MDLVAAKSTTVRQIHVGSVLSRSLLRSSTRNLLPTVRCDGGSSRHFARGGGERESVTRSEVVELLSTALNTLLLPENQKRLQERLRNSRRPSAGLSVEALFPPQIVEQNPSKATQEISVELDSSVDQFGKESPVLECSRATTEIDTGEVKLSHRIHTIDTEASSSSSPYLVPQQVSSSCGNSEESQPPERERMSVHGDIQRVSSSTSETGVSSIEDTALSTIRRLKTLDVHSYVHNALRESFLRSYLRSRKIEE